MPVEWDEFDGNEEADQSSTKIYHVLTLGFEDGTVSLFDVFSGGSILFGSSSEDSGAWFVNPSVSVAKQRRINNTNNNTNCTKNDHSQIVVLSFDSNSWYLSAVNADGDAAIFGPLIWGRQSRIVCRVVRQVLRIMVVMVLMKMGCSTN